MTDMEVIICIVGVAVLILVMTIAIYEGGKPK
jgi:hypothetical protein